MRSKYILIILFIIPICRQLSAQVLIGNIYDQERNPLSYVSVVAISAESKTIETFTQTNEQGRYQLRVKNHGDYLLTLSSLSYRKDTLRVYINKDTVYVKNAILKPAPIALQEVEIRPNVPIFYKKDTVVFNIASFLRGNERVIEDALKNLPGIDVDKQGTVRVNGQEVEKILLEDDDLLNKGYSLLTKGLTVDAVKQVELIHGYTENKLTKGLVHSNKIALNLKLDDKVKHSWLGTLNADYGIDNKYNGQASILGVSKKNKHYLTANVNNTGYTAITDITKILDISEIDISAIKPVNVGITLPDMDLERSNFNQERMLSDNSIFRPNEKWKIQLSVAANTDKRKSYYQTLNEYKIESLSFSHTLQNQAEESPQNYIGKTTITYNPSDKGILESISQYRHNRANGNSSTLFNDFLFNESLSTTEDFFSQKLNYTNRYSDNNLLRINTYYAYSHAPQRYMIDSLENEIQPSRIFRQISNSKKQQFGVRIGNLHRFNSKHTLESHVGIRMNADKIYISKDSINSNTIGAFQIKAWDYYGGILYRFSGRKFSLTGGVELSYYNVRGTNRNTYLWLNPFYMWEWKPNKIHKLNISWVYKNDYPHLMEIFPYLIRNSLTTSSRGTDNIKIPSRWVLELDYQYGSWVENLLANMNLIFMKENQYYSSLFQITQNEIHATRIPLKNKYGAILSGHVEYYVPHLSSNIKLSGGMDYIRYKYMINSLGMLPYTSAGYTYGLSIKSAFNSIFNFDVGGMHTRRILKDENKHITKSNLYTDLFLTKEKWSIETHAEYSYWKGGMHALSSNYCFIDAKMRYVLKPNKWAISLTGENLLNVKTYVENSIDEISQNRYEAKLLPRKILLSIEYKF